MEFWEAMPDGMYLKSPWSASSLSDPQGVLSLNRYSQRAGAAPSEPIPLPYFLEYARWFQHEAVPEIDSTSVRWLSPNGDGYLLRLADGRTVRADRVVVAVGIGAFAHTPEFARDLPAELASHTQVRRDLTALRGRAVALVGSGQSALEWAALLHDAGAAVEVIARGTVHWVSRIFYDGPARRIFYPPTDVGPPGINWIIAFPLVLRRFPSRLRDAMHRRAVRPAGAKWLRPRVEGAVRITSNTSVRGARVRAGRLVLELSDGSTRAVDHLLLGTGYRPDIEKIPFLDPLLRQRVRTRNGFPVLNQWFESTVPGLHFVGGVAGYSFGPLCNFVAGAGTAARQIAKCANRPT
jgi:thioredoxin reductase